MYQQKFVDRADELGFLEEKYNSVTPEFVVLYGRRRVGKTELMLRFLLEGNKKSIYFLASTEGDRQNIKEFSLLAGRLMEDENFVKIDFPDWYSMFESLVKHKKFHEIMEKKKVAIVMDEFPFLIQTNKAIPSVFQRIWELLLKKENIMLCLSGSSVSVMESEVLSRKSPLYGRRTGQWQLAPLDFIHVKEFLPYQTEELAMTWFVTGGIPAYLQKFNPKKSFWENVKENVINKGAYLHDEAEILLNEEFREPRNYKLIFKAIASGRNTLGEISGYSGLDKSMVSKYLEVLSKLYIVEDVLPITSSPKSKKRIYRLSDPYMGFWFRYVYPNKTDLEANRTEEVLSSIKKDYPQYFGHMFESLVEHLIRKKQVLEQFSYTKIGPWWHKEKEIDLIALNDRTNEIVFCECKWQKNVDAGKVLKNLKEKARYVEWLNNERKEHYAVFAKSFKEKTKEENTFLYELKDLIPRQK